MQGYVDCHCHISSKDFDKDLEEVVESSKQAGLLAILAVAEHAGEFEKIIELSQSFIFPCLGVHPVQGVSPEQQRGASLQVRNEPRNVVVSAEFISRVKGVSLQTVMDVTTQNALRLFPKITSKLRPETDPKHLVTFNTVYNQTRCKKKEISASQTWTVCR
ncbi:hypothetical protein F7725_008696 [Dissostichus mawsoni]|uniref:TatD DNase domain containing 3 n=1 Tax=Dissostichus mawsoni TaxID=36200 RepID=A0A7J5Y8R5_DISMA|nr:hypothetical protein F7725_008696 [Dissostichus mawsoni]